MEYISAHRDRWSVVLLCKVLGVSEAGYYKHLRAQGRPDKDAEILELIYALLREDEENLNYGVRRIYEYLRLNKGYTGGQHRISRICRENGLLIRKKRHPHGLTRADQQAQKSENLLGQDFTATAPNQKWLSDITQVSCLDGKLYLCAVLDCYDGSIRGFHMDDNMRAELCIQAFKNACNEDGAHAMIFHSDRGSQFTSHAFRKALRRRAARQSMSSTGRCYDNARMESFFATLKKEKLYRMDTRQLSMSEVKSIIFRYIHYYNRRRIYSTNGGLPPLVFRQAFLPACVA